jgi:biotin carboxyl carrier protein
MQIAENRIKETLNQIRHLIILNKNRMKNSCILTGVFLGLIMTGCRQVTSPAEKTTPTAVPVTVSSIHTGTMANYIDLSATSTYLFKASVKAPVTGYIENMYISQGDAVENNHILFSIKTKEASALNSDSDSNLKFRGVVDVKAAAAGIVSAIDHPKGDYVTEGDQLCLIAVPESFVFILDIPFELSPSVKLNSKCEVILPDGHSVHGFIKSRFPSMTGSSQTERFIVRVSDSGLLPENLIGKIRIIKESIDGAVSLPKSAILTDETMQNYWVMKLINDSTAIKVLVNTGIIENGYVQIKKPVFSETDLFLSSGNYGLGDTVNIRVIKTPDHEK